MIVKKTLSLRAIFRFAGQHLIWLIPWMLVVPALYYFTHWKFITIPILPLSLVGTAVAFYVGFKNNQSYDRAWEARKIWGAFVNDSRKLAAMIKNYRSEDIPPSDESGTIRKEIVYRHIAYLYQFREQLLRPIQWEHVSLHWIFGSFNQRRRDRLFNSFKEELDELAVRRYLSEEEQIGLDRFNNKAAQLLDKQTQSVQVLYIMKDINWMQQSDLQSILNSFYNEQGKRNGSKTSLFPANTPASALFSFASLFFCCPLAWWASLPNWAMQGFG